MPPNVTDIIQSVNQRMARDVEFRNEVTTVQEILDMILPSPLTPAEEKIAVLAAAIMLDLHNA